jgi:hypothetical protein
MTRATIYASGMPMRGWDHGLGRDASPDQVLTLIHRTASEKAADLLRGYSRIDPNYTVDLQLSATGASVTWHSGSITWALR